MTTYITPCPRCGWRGHDERATRYRQVLVGIDLAMQQLACDADTVCEMVDDGRVLWVWDVSARPGRARLLRFWFGELLAPALQRSLRVEEVLAAVIGHETERRLRTRTVAEILGLRRQSVSDLVAGGCLRGPIEGHTQWILRESLEEFLRERLVR